VSASISADNFKTVKPPPLPSTQTGQASLPKLPPKQTVTLSPKVSNLKNVGQANASSTGSRAISPATRPTPPPSNSVDDKKQGDVDIEYPSKAKAAESAASSTSKNLALPKAQPEAASAPKASTSKRM
jgi:hypothetical protein